MDIASKKANFDLIFELSTGHEVGLLDLARIPRRTVVDGSLTSDLV
jgi:hypothetical protein